MNKPFTDQVALVTGAGSGMGRATAIAFARAGATVAVAGRREAEGAGTLALIRAEGAEGHFVQTDVTDEAQVRDLVDRTITEFGRLDFAFNNAGVAGIPLQTHEQTIENYHDIMNTNVLGVLLSMKYEIAAMLRSGGGAIVNNSSVAGLIGFAGLSLFVASKHAVIGLTKSAALEYAAHGIRVNAIAPGGVDTPMLKRFTGGPGTEFHTDLSAMHPLGRTGRPEEIADAVIFLCSDKSSFITGQSLAVDGGCTAQ